MRGEATQAVPKVEDTSWFDPRPALAVTKVAVGAWASVIAAMALGAEAPVGNSCHCLPRSSSEWLPATHSKP